MDLQSLKASGSIVSREKIKVHIKWKIGDVEHDGDIFVLPQTAGSIERFAAKAKAAGDGEHSNMAEFISACVFLGESGEQAIPYEDAYQFHPGLASAMVQAAQAINGGDSKN